MASDGDGTWDYLTVEKPRNGANGGFLQRERARAADCEGSDVLRDGAALVAKSGAERQREYRDRQKVLRPSVEVFIEEFTQALERAGCQGCLRDAPENPNEWLVWAAKLLASKRMVLCKRQGER